MHIRIHITLKSGVLDPQGAAVHHSLTALGFEGIRDVRQGKIIELELAETNRDTALKQVNDMCEKLLANTIIEDYRTEIV